MISISSIKISPSEISYNLSIKLTVVDLPHPLSPTNATFLPGSISKFNLFNIILLFTSLGYLNKTSLNIICPFILSKSGFSVDCEKSIGISLSYKVK